MNDIGQCDTDLTLKATLCFSCDLIFSDSLPKVLSKDNKSLILHHFLFCFSLCQPCSILHCTCLLPSVSSHTSCNALLFPLTFKVDGRGVGAALAGCGLDRVGGVVACARRPGYGTPLGDNGPLTEGNDRVLIFQAPVVIQRMQPSLPDTTAANTPTSTSITVQLLHERNVESVRRTH